MSTMSVKHMLKAYEPRIAVYGASLHPQVDRQIRQMDRQTNDQTDRYLDRKDRKINQLTKVHKPRIAVDGASLHPQVEEIQIDSQIDKQIVDIQTIRLTESYEPRIAVYGASLHMQVDRQIYIQTGRLYFEIFENYGQRF